MKPITAIVLGAGQRGANVYGGYALNFPNELKIVGVAEPREDRRAAFAKAHHIAADQMLCKLGSCAGTRSVCRLRLCLHAGSDALRAGHAGAGKGL